ncbi:MAG: class I SAM-dependent methyltransferase [Synechococcus sp.]
MQRRPEPELMTDQDQVLAYAEADFSAGDQRLLEQLEPLLIGRSDPWRLVDLGCGPGNIALRLAEHWPNAEVIGIDGSAPMLRVARERAQKQDASARFLDGSLQQLAEETLPPGIAPATAVVSNSLLHHLHDPLNLWRLVRRLAVPGTAIVHRDLRRPHSELALDQLQQRYLPTAPECLIADYRASLRAAFTVEEVEAQLQVMGLDQLRVREEDDRYLSVVGVF